MTILIDTKNEMKKSVDGLDGRVSELDRELRAAFAGEIAELRDNGLADLKSSQHETRTSAYNAGKRASEAVTAVTDLRRDVDRLHSGLEDLRRDVQEVLSLLRTTAPVAVGGAAGAPDRVVAGAGDGDGIGPGPLSLPGQRRAPEEEPEPEQPEAQTQAAPEADRGEEEEQDVPRAVLEASERSSDESVKEPYPISWEGRIWAIMRAGRVASATLVCHRDTWEFVAAQVGNHPHFRTPALEERAEGLVAAVLSGRSLVAMLLSLYRVAKTSVSGDADELISYADWAMASQVYYETARVLRQARSDEGDPVVVTIDNRLPASN
ncbi:hypothetical protein [Streptomyces atratus]|uniref:hypothetical protein n=1 Tax=Streptomyces atratus TaxID=1893 RepID=UPI00378CB469